MRLISTVQPSIHMLAALLSRRALFSFVVGRSSRTTAALAFVLCLTTWLVIIPPSQAQRLNILSTVPPDSSTDVPLEVGARFLFDRAIDTTAHGEYGLPIGVIVGPSESLAIGDHRLAGTQSELIVDVTHVAETDYVWIVTRATGQDASSMDVPFVLRYTTSSEWGARTVRGNVFSISPVKRGVFSGHGVVVALLDQPLILESDRSYSGFGRIVAAAPVPEDSEFEIDRIRNGTYWPVAFIDRNGNGRIDADDRVAHYGESEPDSIVVQDEDVDDIQIDLAIGGNIKAPEQPGIAHLGEIHPNPSSAAAQVAFDLERAETVRLGLFNLLGQEVHPIIEAEFLPRGSHQVQWDVSSLAAGAYVFRLEAGGVTQSRLFFVTK